MRYDQKFGFLFFVFLFLYDCNYHYYVQKTSIKSGSIPNLSKVKIAYIGFRPYLTEMTTSSSETRVYTANLMYPDRTIFKFQNGTYASDLKSTGYRKDVSSDKVKKFVQDYLNEVKDSGVLELTYVTSVEKKGEERIFKLKDIGADYYVLGIHTPAFQTSKHFGSSVLQLFSSIFSVISFGLIPSYASLQAGTEIKIYDKNLNQLTSIKYDHGYSILGAVWASSVPQECRRMGCNALKQVVSPPKFVYQELGPQFEMDVVNFIQARSVFRK
ncbi:Lp29 family lipoprotein [Leptospira alexanderi]